MKTFNELYDPKDRTNANRFIHSMILKGLGDSKALIVYGVASKHMSSKCFVAIVKEFGIENLERARIVPVAKRRYKRQGTVNVIYLAN